VGNSEAGAPASEFVPRGTLVASSTRGYILNSSEEGRGFRICPGVSGVSDLLPGDTGFLIQ